MSKSVLTLVLLFMTVFFSKAQTEISLYPDDVIPGAKTTPDNYIEKVEKRPSGNLSITKISTPTLTVFEAPKNLRTGMAVIICPGGGYNHLAFSHEGTDVAKRFNEIGVTAFVLKYRLPSNEIMDDKAFALLQDAEQAVYLVRKQAKKYSIKTNRIGIIGFSAGGHLAATLITHYNDLKIADKEKINLRPDFAVLAYPVISFQQSVHTGTMKNLLGTNPTDSLKRYFSADQNITKNTPPVFLVQAKDDKTVPVENSILMYDALKKQNVETEIYLYEKGGHGFGLTNKTSDVDWFELMTVWLKKNQFLK